MQITWEGRHTKGNHVGRIQTKMDVYQQRKNMKKQKRTAYCHINIIIVLTDKITKLMKLNFHQTTLIDNEKETIYKNL